MTGYQLISCDQAFYLSIMTLFSFIHARQGQANEYKLES